MRLPDFLVVGAQKSGTTSLFLLLRRHPRLFLPSRKEIQFFSSEELFSRGLDWYADSFFANCGAAEVAGEVSPQYLYSTRIARRVHDALPGAKIIAILREPIDRAYSQYLMSTRRSQETRPVTEAFAASAEIGEDDTEAPEWSRYFQFSDYEKVLSEYLRLYGRDQVLVLFQEDLDRDPSSVLRRVMAFLGVPYVGPANPNVRAHRSGHVRFKALDRLAKGDSGFRRVLRWLVPARLRPTIMFWSQIMNVKPTAKSELPPEVRRAYASFAKRQAAFISKEFGAIPPWQDLDEIE